MFKNLNVTFSFDCGSKKSPSLLGLNKAESMSELKQDSYVRYSVKNQAGVAQISLIGGFGWWENNSDEFTKQVDSLINAGIRNVFVYMNSPGGDMVEANEIANQIKRFSPPRKGKLGAMCASAATTVASELDEVEAAPNCMYMIHEPSLRTNINRPADWESQKKLYDNLRNNAISVYVRKTGQSNDKISEMMSAETWLTAKEALAMGFINSISGQDESLPDDVASSLRNFKKLPQVLNNIMNLNGKENVNSSKPPIINKQEEKRMKLLAAKMGLKEDATEAEYIAAYEKAQTEALKAQGATENGVKVLVAMGTAKGFKKEHLESFAKADFNGCLNMVQEAPEPKAANAAENEAGNPQAPAGASPAGSVRISEVANAVADVLKGGSVLAAEKKFGELTMAEKAEMLNKAPAKLQALFKAEYGLDVKIEDLKARYAL